VWLPVLPSLRGAPDCRAWLSGTALCTVGRLRGKFRDQIGLARHYIDGPFRNLTGGFLPDDSVGLFGRLVPFVSLDFMLRPLMTREKIREKCPHLIRGVIDDPARLDTFAGLVGLKLAMNHHGGRLLFDRPASTFCSVAPD